MFHGPHINNFKEIYSLLDNKKITVKVNNLNQLALKLNTILKKDINSIKLIYELKKLGDKILHSTLLEIKKFIK